MKALFFILLTSLLPLIVNSTNFYQFSQAINADFESNENPLPEQWFVQKLCHFNNKTTTTWKQRFWNNSAFYDPNHEIQWLWIGGETAASPVSIQNEKLPMVYWGKGMGVNLWVLEHRFYGKSRPTNNTSVANLKYLSAKQAVEDLAYFIRSKNEELKLKNPKWVLFGGSYPGNLALWFKKKYPDLVKGVITSSAPLRLTVDFRVYFQTVEEDYYISSPSCSGAIWKSFQRITNAMATPGGRKNLDDAFNMNNTLAKKWPLSESEFAVFYYNLTVGLTTQMATRQHIDEVCKAFLDGNEFDPIKRLINARKVNNLKLDFTPSIDYEGRVNFLKETQFKDLIFDFRLWTWQGCSELGFFHVIEENAVFMGNVPKSYYYNLCKDVFGDEFTPENIEKNVQKSIEYFGSADSYNATDVLLTYGSLDPWSKLGLHETHNSKQTHSSIAGASHMSDLLRVADLTGGDIVGFEKAQDKMYARLFEWGKWF